MKTLYIVRHAKSSWGDSSQQDWERPLNERGLRVAPEMARRLKARDVTLDRLVTSFAVRAKTTAEIFMAGLELSEAVLAVDEGLYGASAQDWLRTIQQLDEAWQTVMMVGHNPSITELIQFLGRTDIANVPTCGVLEVRYEGGFWGNFGDQSKDLQIGFDYPNRTAD